MNIKQMVAVEYQIFDALKFKEGNQRFLIKMINRKFKFW